MRRRTRSRVPGYWPTLPPSTQPPRRLHRRTAVYADGVAGHLPPLALFVMLLRATDQSVWSSDNTACPWYRWSRCIAGGAEWSKRQIAMLRPDELIAWLCFRQIRARRCFFHAELGPISPLRAWNSKTRPDLPNIEVRRSETGGLTFIRYRLDLFVDFRYSPTKP